uniref:Uncharacterized protein n=1 Tax=Acrobeloides nanus TaxID=290746 RepID=A0A914D6Q3_9BILA
MDPYKTNIPYSTYDQERAYGAGAYQPTYTTSVRPRQQERSRAPIYIGLIACGFCLVLIPTLVVIIVFKLQYNPNYMYGPDGGYARSYGGGWGGYGK